MHTNTASASQAYKLALLLALAPFGVSPRLLGQTAGLPFPADIRQTEVMLTNLQQTVTAHYALIDRQLIYFSPTFPEKVELNGQPLVAANGSLRVQPNGQSQLLTVTFRDPEVGLNARNILQSAIIEAPDVLRANGNVPPQPSPALISKPPTVALIWRGGLLPIGVSAERQLPAQVGNPTPQVTFELDDATLRFLARLDPKEVEIVFLQDYPARFLSENVVLSVENLERQFGSTRQTLVPIPDGAPGGGTRAGIVLDATALGLDITQDGTLANSQVIKNFISRNVNFNVRYREDAALDTALLERLITHALTAASGYLQKAPFDGDQTFVTLLFANNIQITTAIGHLDEFTTRMETGHQDELFTKLIEAASSDSSVNVGTEAKVGIPGLTASGKVDVGVKLHDESYLEQLRQEFHAGFRYAAGLFKGSIPYLPGIRYVSDTSVQNVRWQAFNSVLTQFTTNNITLRRGFQLTALLDRQKRLTIFEMFDSLIASNEQFMQNLSVPNIETGNYNAPTTAQGSATDWVDLGAGDFVHDVVIRFSKPFETPPNVVTALSRMDGLNANPESIYIRSSARDVSRSQFTLRIHVYNGGNRTGPIQPAKWFIGASWVATGSAKLGASQGSAFMEFRNAVGNDQAISTTEHHFAASPWISPAITPDANNHFSVKFSSVPRRAYLVESSTDLNQWDVAGSVTAGANDLNTTFRYTPDEQFPQLFFRVTSQ
jgi:hypothetical protein